jgi:D-alanyl-D-alanine carboxypeptidase
MLFTFNIDAYETTTEYNDSFSKASIIIDQETSRVIYEKNADMQLPLASLSKMMTFLIAIEAIENGEVSKDDIVKIDEEAAKVAGSTYNLKEGEEVPLIELMKGLMIVSGNDASVAIAKHISGTQEKFVERMNNRTKELGLKNTNFINPNGLPIYQNGDQMTIPLENKSSARDIALLGKYMMDKYETQVTDITDMQTYTYDERNFSKNNTNSLLSAIPEVDGIKTGYTGNAGYCLCFSMKIAKNDNNEKDRRVIGVTLGANHKNKRMQAATSMLNYAKNNTKTVKVQDKDELIGKRYLKGISELEVELVTDSDYFVTLKNDEKVNRIINLSDIKYPIKKGEKIGSIIYKTDKGEMLGSSDIVSGEEVKTNDIVRLIQLRIK